MSCDHSVHSSRVLDSRPTADNDMIIRRRLCSKCHMQFFTMEHQLPYKPTPVKVGNKRPYRLPERLERLILAFQEDMRNLINQFGKH